MRWLTIGVAVLAVLWGGWWLVGSAAVERGAVAGIAEARARGWDVTYDALSVAGFPNRFDVTVDAPRVASPDGDWTWSAPFVQIFALSYRPNRLIAVAPHEMTIGGRAATVAVTSDDLRASAALTASLRPELIRATLVGTGIATAGTGLDATLDRVQVSVRKAEGEAEYDVALDLAGLRPGEALRGAVDPFGTLPATVDSLDVDMHATLDRPLEAGGRPALTALRVSDARLVWGDLRLSLAGAVEIGPDGVPEGALTLDAAGWQAALRLAASLGIVPAERLPLLTAGLAGMAEEDGTASFEITFAGGEMRLGPIPLGPAPRL